MVRGLPSLSTRLFMRLQPASFKDVNSIDKTLMEKISLIELLDKKEKAAFFTMLDALVSKKKLKDNLTSALQLSA